MKTTFLFLLTATAAFAASVVYEVRPAPGTRLELTVDKTGLLSGKRHVFSFREFRGMLNFDREAPERSAVMLSIESASALCRDTWLSAKDLRKVQEYALKDMLAADRYPAVTFRSTTVRKMDADRYEVQGLLAIRETSRPVTLLASLQMDASGSPVIEGTAIIRLTDFGLKPPTAALGTIGTKNEMSFRFTVAGLKGDHGSTGTE